MGGRISHRRDTRPEEPRHFPLVLARQRAPSAGIGDTSRVFTSFKQAPHKPRAGPDAVGDVGGAGGVENISFWLRTAFAL